MPLEHWELKSKENFIEDNIAIYILFCEDENSEPAYFRSFSIEKVLKVIPMPNQDKGNKNFLNTVNNSVRDGSMEYTKEGYRIKENVLKNIWSVYDRDIEEPNPDPINDLDFTNAINNAETIGINVAWSNDAFELWVLLHFEKVPVGTKLHRNYIYKRLTDILKNLPTPSDELREITSNRSFNYKDHAKKRNTFTRYILPILKDKTNTAIQNATALEAIYPHHIPFHDRNPCTMVHHLVQEILAFHTS
jgi:hypothetical protein